MTVNEIRRETNFDIAMRVAEASLASRDTPEDNNDLRRKVAAMQKFIARRKEDFGTAWKAGKLYCEASAQAGQKWATFENKRTRGDRGDGGISPSGVGAEDAGFLDRHDASVCVRIGEMHPEDRRTYYEDCQTNNRVPTIGGLYHAWHLLNPKEGEDPEDFALSEAEAAAGLGIALIKNAVDARDATWLISPECIWYFECMGMTAPPALMEWAKKGCPHIQIPIEDVMKSAIDTAVERAKHAQG